MNRHELNEAVLNTYSKEQMIGLIKQMYKDNKELERTLSKFIEECDKTNKALDMACEILSHDLQKIDINGDEKLVWEKAEKWKEFFLNYEEE